MIQLGRVSQLFHKAKDFEGKQRRIAGFASKYLISGRDAVEKTVGGSKTELQSLKSKLTNRQNYPKLSMQEQGEVVDNLLQNFDPKDTTYKRLFFEITGQNLTPGEFDNDDSDEIVDEFAIPNRQL